jgi:hypothetical protein
LGANPRAGSSITKTQAHFFGRRRDQIDRAKTQTFFAVGEAAG